MRIPVTSLFSTSDLHMLLAAFSGQPKFIMTLLRVTSLAWAMGRGMASMSRSSGLFQGLCFPGNTESLLTCSGSLFKIATHRAQAALTPQRRLMSVQSTPLSLDRIILNEVPEIHFDGTPADATTFRGDGLIIPVYQVHESRLLSTSHTLQLNHTATQHTTGGKPTVALTPAMQTLDQQLNNAISDLIEQVLPIHSSYKYL